MRRITWLPIGLALVTAGLLVAAMLVDRPALRRRLAVVVPPGSSIVLSDQRSGADLTLFSQAELAGMRATEVAVTPAAKAPAETWLRIGVVILVLGAALYVILSGKYPDADRKWAYGVVGAILGYVLGNGGV